MSKVTKNKRIKELERQVRGLTVLFSSLNTWSEYADNMLTELNHALPDPEYDAKCEADESAISASLDRHCERLGLNKPQLKQLDQSIFNGLDEKWKSAATNTDGKAYLHNMPKSMMYFNHSSYGWCSKDYDAHEMQLIGDGFDPSGFAVGFIERDIAKELTGSELCKAMLARGDRWILCGNTTDGFASPCIIDGYRCSEDDLGFVLTNGKSIEPRYIYPVNNQGEPLTAAEAGL